MHKLALLVTCFNQEQQIIKTLDTLVNQSLDNNLYTIYVSDDQSTDNSLSVLNEYAKQHDNVVITTNLHKSFVGANRNHLINIFEEEFAIFIDGDDPQDKGFVKSVYDQLDDKHDTFFFTNFTEVWNDKRVEKNALNYDNFMFKAYSKKLLKNTKVNDQIMIGEDVEYAFRYFQQLHENSTTINANYLLNRCDENISLTKNSDMQKRYNLELDLYNLLNQETYTSIEELNSKINNKRVELIQLAIMLDQTPHQFAIDSKCLTSKFKISYYVYRITKTLHCLGIYKFLLIKKIGHKI